MATFVKHTSCKRCGSSDALAHYSDGGEYCFSCGAVGGADRPGFLSATSEEPSFKLPDSLSRNFTQEQLNWIKPTGITVTELIQNDYYSQVNGLLWRVLEHGCAESRRVAPHGSGPKNRFYGVKSTINGTIPCRRSGGEGMGSHLLQNGRPHYEEKNGDSLQQEGASSSIHSAGNFHCLVIVEDSLSAIKCARHLDAVPLFGSSISNEKLVRITKEYKLIYVWLDSDKYSQAQLIAGRIKMLGKQSRVIYTELDPKYLDANHYVT